MCRNEDDNKHSCACGTQTSGTERMRSKDDKLAPRHPCRPGDLLGVLPTPLSLMTPFSLQHADSQKPGQKPASKLETSSSQILTSSDLQLGVTLAVAVPPSNNVFPTSSGPQLCVGKLRLLPVLPADTHATAGNIPALHRCRKNALKCVR